MDQNDRSTIVIFASAMFLIAVPLTIGLFINHLNEKNFIEHGYTREAIQGVVGYQWQLKK